jgi:DNA-binding CsgD family transcriptional regulator
MVFAQAGSTGLVLVSAFQFAAALAAAGGFYGFCYVSNNAERWFVLGLIGLYYALSMLVSPLAESWFVLTRLLPPALTVALVICVWTKRLPSFRAPNVSHESQSSGKLTRKRFSVLVLVALYYLISLTDSWLESAAGFLLSVPFGFGMLAGLACAALIQLACNRSVWHLWNLYLFFAVVGLLVAMFAEASNLVGILGSLLNGMADNLGYLAMLYLMGGTASRDGSHYYYRVICLFAFLFSSVVPFVLEKTFATLGPAAPTYAMALVFACVGGYILLSPLLRRYIFAADWMDGLGEQNLQAYTAQATEVAAIDCMEDLGLTPREREVLTLLLTDIAAKQIAHQLKISTSTFNYHSANLYRKLEVNSRIELITRFSTTNLQ